MGNFICK